MPKALEKEIKRLEEKAVHSLQSLKVTSMVGNSSVGGVSPIPSCFCLDIAWKMTLKEMNRHTTINGKPVEEKDSEWMINSPSPFYMSETNKGVNKADLPQADLKR